MKKLFMGIFVAFMGMSMALTSCKKEPVENPEGDSPIAEFCGTYDLTIVTDSVQNSGTWFSNSTLPEVAQIPTRMGRLTITKVEGKEEVDVLGRLCIVGDSVDYYRTTGKLDAQGRLQLESGQPYTNTTRTQRYTFSPIEKGETMVFKVDASYKFNGTDYVERSTNTAKKR